MRAFISFVLSLVLLGILGAIGVGIYNAGVSAGLAQAGAVAAGAAAPYIYGWGLHPFVGFGFLGLLGAILFLFLIAGLLRASLGVGRHGWDRGWDAGIGPASWRADRERRWAELHRQFHDAERAGRGGSSDTDRSADVGR